MFLISHATAVPDRVFSQAECFERSGYRERAPELASRMEAVFRMAGVRRRAFVLSDRDIETVRGPEPDRDELHRIYVDGVRSLAPLAARRALERAGLSGGDLDYLVFVSCTGYTCPGFSLELAATLGMASDRPTANLLGMGCAALVPGIERAYERLRAGLARRALVIAAEICSSTCRIEPSLETAVGNALFADGAAAILLSSDPADGARLPAIARIEGFRTLRDERYLGDMGFTWRDGRLRVRLAREIPERIMPLALRVAHSLELEPRPGEGRVAIHPGGRKILDLIEDAVSAGGRGNWSEALAWSRATLADFGNMSSPTVAFVLDRSFRERPFQGRESGALVTMGPGLSVEGVRLTWDRAGEFGSSRFMVGK